MIKESEGAGGGGGEKLISRRRARGHSGESRANLGKQSSKKLEKVHLGRQGEVPHPRGYKGGGGV